MIRRFLLAASVALASSACSKPTAQETPKPAPPSQSQTASKGVSIQEMLVTGPPQLKIHSLAMLSQGHEGRVDESYLPGFTICSKDTSSPIRSITARLLGEYFVKGQEDPNSEALNLLMELAHDESSDVRFNAVYYGISQIKIKTDETLAFLVEFAANHREHGMIDRIAESLIDDQDKVVEILDQKLAESDNVAVFEIYEDLTGVAPLNATQYMDMPSSRPRMFILKGTGADSETEKSALEAELKTLGITRPLVHISGPGKNYVLIVKTYITQDGIAVEKTFSKDGRFKITQQIWVTPELEIQMEAMRKAQREKEANHRLKGVVQTFFA